MTLETIAAEPEFMCAFVVVHKPAVGQKLTMAPDAVLMNNLLTRFLDKDHLRFKPQSEHGSVPQPVLCLEVILVEYIVVGDMTVVAVGPFTMGTVVPGCILGSHNVAVDTCFRLVAQVRGCVGYVKRKYPQPGKNTKRQDNRKSPVIRRNKISNKLPQHTRK